MLEDMDSFSTTVLDADGGAPLYAVVVARDLRDG